MKKEFVPYEQALSLKELGFYEQCLGCYIVDKTKNGDIPHFKIFNQNTHCQVLTPLYQQAFRWLREKHNLQLGICHISGGFDCWTNDGDLFENGKYCNFKTYEEAELECLKKLIEIAQKEK